ncbi:lymphotoxin-alpha-like [Pristis pectinata]|uniref:lymphotoxin-alpha-like n=1 Tax=Pristis pectinata TaxID=685728 RepID=UPI00223E4082|nr:lymphotoxin-alpha-like [Pristis pectinata]
MAGTRTLERSLLWCSALLTCMLVSSNLLLAAYFRRVGLQCLRFPPPRPTNCSHESPGSPAQVTETQGGDLVRKPAAHLTGSSGGNVSEEHTPLWLLQWDFGTGMAYTNMVYADGHLHIPRRGLYYVYSQVAFYLASCQEQGSWGGGGGGVLAHNVYRRSEAYPEPLALLTATKSACGSGQGDWHATISQGGLFYLHRRDRLFVTVNRPATVEHREQKTFFGAFMV